MNKASIFILALIAIVIFWNTPKSVGEWRSHPPVAINSKANPGEVDGHSNSGGRRIVRIKDTIIVICPHKTGERTYRSTDNGESWVEIDKDGGSSGCLISGPNETIYHFYRKDNNIYMVKFRYSNMPPDPVSIYSTPNLSKSITGLYRALNAIVGPDGRLYVACHWGTPDRLFLLRSSDNGVTWNGPFEISEDASGWYYPHLEVNSQNILVCAYDKFKHDEHEIIFAKSADGGKTWTRKSISREITFNPSLLTVGESSFFIFAQSVEKQHRGLVFKISTDIGNTWSKWQLIEKTCGYADPSPALAEDGTTIFVAYRSSNKTGIKTGSCGNRSRSRLTMSPDLGRNWNVVDHYYEGERTGTRNQTRYQTWWNYGGPLEWIWMQYESKGSNRPIYYDINHNIQIFNMR